MTKSEFIAPCCPVPGKAVPVGHGWQHEVKFDGYRVQIHKAGKDVVIFSGNGHDFTFRFDTIAFVLRDLPTKAAVLDGEIVQQRLGRPGLRQVAPSRG
jgi:bifunctional non-homologous end joining protein LigD